MTIEMPRLSRTPATTAAVHAALLGGHAGDGFVQEKDLGFHAEGAAELDELLLPVREGACGEVEFLVQSDELGYLPDAFEVPPCLAGRGGQPEAGGDESGAGEPVPSEHEALGDGGVRGQGQVLEGAGDAEAA